MRRITITLAMALLAVSPAIAVGQMGGTPRGGMGGPGFMRRAEGSAPKLPGPELEGPPDSATIRPVINLNPDQAQRYAAARDSFMIATKVERDSAGVAQDLMYQKLDAGDRAAALFYAERLRGLGRSLREQQEQFEKRLSAFLTGDQMKAYRQWRRDQDRAAEAKAKGDAGRWMVMPFGESRPAAEPKSFINEPGLPRPDAGSQAVRVGRTVYVTSQVPVDDAGALVGAGDLGAQATRAFANLTRILGAARLLPQDVVRLVVYVVNYGPEDLVTIRRAGAVYLPDRNSPVLTVVGVQSLSREGCLIAVEATAVEGNASSVTRMPER